MFSPTGLCEAGIIVVFTTFSRPAKNRPRVFIISTHPRELGMSAAYAAASTFTAQLKVTLAPASRPLKLKYPAVPVKSYNSKQCRGHGPSTTHPQHRKMDESGPPLRTLASVRDIFNPV